MQTKITNLEAAMLAHKPALQADYVKQIRATYNYLIGIYTTENFDCASGKHNAAWQVAAPVVKNVGTHFARDFQIVEEKLESVTATYAEMSIQNWVSKLNAKVEGLTNATCIDFRGGNIVIEANKDGHKITITQKRILNCSANGNLFHQFPALIYVDGKKVSEAAYKKMTAAA